MSLKHSYTLIAPFYDAAIARATHAARARSLSALPTKAGKVLLAGVGTGLDLPHLPPQHHYVGLDLNQAMLCRALPRTGHIDFVPVQGDAQRLPFADASFDCAVLHLILAVVPQPAHCFAEIERVLKPGGWLLLSDLHPVSVLIGGTAVFPDPEAPPGRLSVAHTRNLYHPISSYIAAFTGAGLRVVDCQEIPMPESAITSNPVYPLIPDAVTQAFAGMPFILTWHATKP